MWSNDKKDKQQFKQLIHCKRQMETLIRQTLQGFDRLCFSLQAASIAATSGETMCMILIPSVSVSSRL